MMTNQIVETKMYVLAGDILEIDDSMIFDDEVMVRVAVNPMMTVWACIDRTEIAPLLFAKTS